MNRTYQADFEQPNLPDWFETNQELKEIKRGWAQT